MLQFKFRGRVERVKKNLYSLLEGDKLVLTKVGFYALFSLATLLLVLPLLCIPMVYQRGKELDAHLTQMETKVRAAAKRRVEREAFMSRYGATNGHFVHDVLEGYSLLNQEKELLTNLSLDYAPLQKRLDFLNGEENKLCFEKKKEGEGGKFTEILWSLDHPVESDLSDIEGLLSLVEGKKVARPQLWVTHFTLKWPKLDRKNFMMEIELLERQYHEESR